MKEFHLKIFSLLVAIFVVFGILFNYDATWTHPEMPGQFLINVFETGPTLNQNDFKRAWDWESFCGGPRSRILSTLLLIINAKFRHWLWHLIPPHPSLSLFWLSSAISLVFFFLFVKNYTASRQTAYICTLLLCASTGFISTLAMNFHPGKPLSLMWFCICLHMSSITFLTPNQSLRPPPPKKYFTLLFLLFIGFFIDETAWFTWVAIPILYPQVFFNRTAPFFGTPSVPYLLPFFAFLFTLTFIFPPIANTFGYPGFPFWQYAIGTNNELTGFHYHRYFQNIYLFLRSQFFNTHHPLIDFTGNLLIYIYLFLMFKSIPQHLRPPLRRCFHVLLAYLVFQTLLMTKHLHLLKSPYYYGLLSSPLLALTIGVLFQQSSKRFRKTLPFALAFLLITFCISSFTTNQRWIKGHITFYKVRFPETTARMHPQKNFSYQKAKTLWLSRNNPSKLWEIGQSIPLSHLSVLWELSQQNRSWSTLTPQQIQSRFGHAPFSPQAFRSGSYNTKSSMAASLLKQAPTYVGKLAHEIRKELGPSDLHCLRTGTPVYSLEKDCPNGRDKFKLAFILSNVNQNSELRIQKLSIVKDCCLPLWGPLIN